MNIFGNVHLGYVVIETERFADWRRFGRDAIGMHLDETLPDVMRFRLDDNECRFLLQRGPAEDVTALGWHIDDHQTFDEILTRVTRHGVPVIERDRGGGQAARCRASRTVSRPQRAGTGDLHSPRHRRITAGHGRGWRLRHRRSRYRPCRSHIQEAASGARVLQHRVRRSAQRLHRRNHQRPQVQNPLPARQPTPPLGGDRRGQPVADQPDPHPRSASQHPGRRPRRHDRVLSAGQRTRLRHGTGGRPAHQRPRAVLLRDDAVGLRMGSRLEPRSSSTKRPGSRPRTRASASGDTPGKVRRSSTSSASSRLQPSRCCTAKTPSPRCPAPASPTTEVQGAP